MNGLTFTAIDFETANSDRLSACSMGLCTVVDGKIEDSCSFLIRPPQEATHFDSVNVSIHGITYEKVRNCGFFCDKWPVVESAIKDKVIVAHNMSFDNSVLSKLLDRYSIEPVHKGTLCTVKLAKKALPDLINHKLDTVSKYVGYDMKETHHDAGADAIACAKILLYIAEKNNLKDMTAVSIYMNVKNKPNKLDKPVLNNINTSVYHGPVGANSSTIFWNPKKKQEAEQRHAEEKIAEETKSISHIDSTANKENIMYSDICGWWTDAVMGRGDDAPSLKQFEYIKVLYLKYKLNITEEDLYSVKTARLWISKAVDYSRTQVKSTER